MYKLLLAVVLVVGCQRGDKANQNQGSAAATPGGGIESTDILNRTETSTEVDVKHVLIGWKELEPASRGHMDPRAHKRTQAEADKLALDVASQLKTKPDSIDALLKEHSEDPGSQRGTPYTVKSDTPFVPEFKQLALRL